jgi:hypothetical protein
MKEKKTTLTDATFLSSRGQVLKVADVVTEKECWYVDKEKRWVLAHKAIQKIAALAGISKNYTVEESATVQPTYKNELEHIVRVTIKCFAKRPRQRRGCWHDTIDNTLTVTGEANKLNTPVRGRGYLRKMAEKRAYDIAVLEHVGLYDTTFSEEESETMLGKSPSAYQSVEISNVELESLRDEINMLVDCDTKKKLENVEKIIAERKAKNGYDETQLKYLAHLVEDRRQSIVGPVEDDKPF